VTSHILTNLTLGQYLQIGYICLLQNPYLFTTHGDVPPHSLLSNLWSWMLHNMLICLYIQSLWCDTILHSTHRANGLETYTLHSSFFNFSRLRTNSQRSRARSKSWRRHCQYFSCL